MEIAYTTKAESNRRREAEFLALSGDERVAEFLALSRRILREYPSGVTREYGNNLVLDFASAERKTGSTNDDATSPNADVHGGEAR